MDWKNRSKFLSLVLRHKPETIGIGLDPEGWVDVETLLSALDDAGRGIRRSELEALVAENDKKRFTLSDDGARIRAAQGHSVNVSLGLSATAPPDVLYHGTAHKNLASIMATGLEPRHRRHVHLSSDVSTALRVGSRHGKPIVLSVAAKAMIDTGYEFFQADNGVWLTALVPPRFLKELKKDDEAN